MRKFNAFTLAEVLITLGIIGVVAAMTMPTLINQTNGAQYKAAYKKALSAISQGVTLNVALDDISFADTVKGVKGSTDCPKTKDKDGKDTTTCSGTSVASLLNSRMNIVKASETAGYDTTGNVFAGVAAVTCGEGSAAGCVESPAVAAMDTFLFFNDSSMFAFNTDAAKGCTKDNAAVGSDTICSGYIDVNGAKGPNKLVACDSGTGTGTTKPCTVTSPTDIYPVQFYDQTITPASEAAKAVLYGK